jgi:hypothetical protein
MYVGSVIEIHAAEPLVPEVEIVIAKLKRYESEKIYTSATLSTTNPT